MDHRRLRPVLLLAAGLAACSGCAREERAGAEAAVPAPAAPSGTTSATPPGADGADSAPSQDRVEPPPNASGPDAGWVTYLAPAREVELFARMAGVITALDVEEGQRVPAGRRLAQIEDDAQRYTLEEREAELLRARAAFERARKLHGDNMLSEQEFLDARSGFEGAQARRDRARLDKDRCAVRSPIGGVVSLRLVQRGQMVQEGQRLFRVSDLDTLRAELLLPEEQLGRVHAGQAVTLLPRVGGAPARARVTRVNPVVDAASGTFRVVIDLDNRHVGLPAGISVRCRFEPAPTPSPR